MSTLERDWKPSDKIDGVDAAMGASSTRDLMPAYSDLPKDFQSFRGPWCKVVEGWFFSGLKKSEYRAKDGIDENAAWRHLRAIMGSFEPQHEHKIGGVAWLMSQWFEKVEEKASA